MAFGLLNPNLMAPPQRLRSRGILGGIPDEELSPMAGGSAGLFGAPQAAAPLSPPPPPGAGPVPAGPRSRVGERLRGFLDPEIALPMAGAMIAGETPGESFGNAFMMAGQGIGAKRKREREEAQRRKTLEFLKQRDPELAGMVESGMDVDDAFGVIAAERKAGSSTDDFGFPTTSAMSQKIRAYQMQGFDPQQALGLASGRYSVSVNPMNGERVLIDVASQEIIPLRQSGATQAETAQVEQPGPAGPSLYDMADEATGVGSSIAGGLSNTVGQVPGPVGDMATFPKQVEAQQNFDLFKRDLVRSLSLNPRFPVAEQKRIEDLVPRGAFTAPETLKTSLKALDAELARIEAETAQAMANPDSPVEQRQADAQTNRAVKAARQRLGVPQGVSGGWGGGNAPAAPGRTSSGVQWSVE